VRPAVAIAFLGAVACERPPEPIVETAAPSDAAGFLAWPRQDVPTTDRFPHAVYVNELAARGEPWQPGAILVRTEELGSHERWVIHGMLRRADAGFNAAGASGWEYFGLVLGDGDVGRVLWRGETPPAGMGYVETAAVPDGDCNGCHHDPDPILSR
jgi:hypothetical protein